MNLKLKKITYSHSSSFENHCCVDNNIEGGNDEAKLDVNQIEGRQRSQPINLVNEKYLNINDKNINKQIKTTKQTYPKRVIQNDKVMTNPPTEHSTAAK
jgi:hypothetical protein